MFCISCAGKAMGFRVYPPDFSTEISVFPSHADDPRDSPARHAGIESFPLGFSMFFWEYLRKSLGNRSIFLVEYYIWLVVTGILWNFMTFHSVGNVIIPTGELHHFSEGWLNHQPGSNL